MTTKFQLGVSYSTRSVCNHDLIISITVKSRTAKTIKTECGKTLRVTEYEGVEQVKPWGSYSMAPSISAASRPVEKKQSSKEMLSSEEFNSLFSAEEQASITSVLIGSSKAGAKIYDFAAYRASLSGREK